MSVESASSPAARRILVVDDDPDITDIIDVWLRSAGYEVVTANSANKALHWLDTVHPELVITDLSMPGMDGMQLLEHIQVFDPTLPVLMVSGNAGIPDAVDATHRGVVGFQTKPLKREQLIRSVGDAIGGDGQVAESETRAIEGIVHRGSVMARLLERVRRAARGSSTIMIEGESGTGKELLARAIHRASPRRDQPFVAINCGAMPEPLLESELFGHVKGAFTGAASTRQGLFQAADGGTLFLDEVGDMPLSLQVRLLRVLQDGRVRPVGSTEEFPVDARVVTASHRDLEDLVAQGSFREDLYYRLNVVPIQAPALRERREDIPALVEHFLDDVHGRLGEGRRRFAPAAMDRLLAAPWPGNIRQLANVVEQCVVLSTSTVIPVHLVERALKHREDRVEPFDTAVRGFERQYLVRLLSMTGGNVSRAARLAGRNRTDFYNILRRHDLEAAAFRSR
ncbi:MAG: sigma-54-dependent transcriptional regulator [Gammaproteobacteria bacterium]